MNNLSSKRCLISCINDNVPKLPSIRSLVSLGESESSIFFILFISEMYFVFSSQKIPKVTIPFTSLLLQIRIRSCHFKVSAILARSLAINYVLILLALTSPLSIACFTWYRKKFRRRFLYSLEVTLSEDCTLLF